MTYEVVLEHCHFVEDVDMSYSHFENRLSLNDSVFSGLFDARFAHFNVFQAQSATFEATREVDGYSVHFYTTKVDNDFNLSGAHFHGEVDFGFMQCIFFTVASAHFFAKPPAIPDDAKWSSFFDGVNVVTDLSLQSTVFDSGASFSRMTIGANLIADEARFDSDEARYKSYNFYQNSIRANATFPGAQFASLIPFVGGNIGGNLDLSDTTFTRGLDLTNTTIMGVADFDRIALGGPLWLNGMKSRDVTYRGNNNTGPLELARLAVYSPSVYKNLEANARERGDTDLANKIFIADKRRASDERSHGPTRRLPLLADNLEDKVIGYGKKPANAFYYAFIVIVIGTVLFWPHRIMALKDSGDDATKCKHRRYNPFFYSLDAFLPGVGLGVESDWRIIDTSDQKRFRSWGWYAWYYRFLHKLLGWILIPVGLAAITGIIK